MTTTLTEGAIDVIELNAVEIAWAHRLARGSGRSVAWIAAIVAGADADLDRIVPFGEATGNRDN